ncbi:helix-turn-helix domain-containing protein [Kitasatospora aureofaciens]|uniref:helix-turn-helix domain-containing protein n=1 Tax=Kitasatospora aureofaciens TaxID=1894 RepID=UPI0033CBC763
MDTEDLTQSRRGRPRRGDSKADRLDPGGPVLTSEMAADRLALNPRTVMKRARSGDLPGVKLGGDWRFSTAALDAAVQGQPWRDLPFRDEVLTTKEVCALLGMGPDKVGKLARRGELPHWGETRCRRFSRAAILRTLCGTGSVPDHDAPSPVREDSES